MSPTLGSDKGLLNNAWTAMQVSKTVLVACAKGTSIVAGLLKEQALSVSYSAATGPIANYVQSTINSWPTQFAQAYGVKIWVRVYFEQCGTEKCFGIWNRNNWLNDNVEADCWPPNAMGWDVNDFAGIAAAVPGCIRKAIQKVP